MFPSSACLTLIRREALYQERLAQERLARSEWEIFSRAECGETPNDEWFTLEIDRDHPVLSFPETQLSPFREMLQDGGLEEVALQLLETVRTLGRPSVKVTLLHDPWNKPSTQEALASTRG